MRLRRLGSIVRKEVRQLRRDQQLLGLFLAAPLLQLLFFGYAVTADVRGVPVGVVLEDPSPQAQRLIEAIEQQKPALELTRVSPSPGDMRPWLDRGEVQLALDIPPGFTAALANGLSPVVQVLSDGSDANTATLAYQYLSGAAQSWARSERADHLRRHPEAAIRFAGAPQVEVVPRFWYNPDLSSTRFMIPGVLTVILLVVAMAHTALMVVRERELGTLEQLNVTPIHAAELLVGKTVPAAGLAMVTALVITVIATVGFHVPLRGQKWFLLLCGMLYLLNTMGMGLLISVISRTQLQAQLTSNILISPLLVLSGFLFPVANMPRWAQVLTWAMPTRYFMDVVRGVFLKGQGFGDLWWEAAALAGLGLLFYLGGILSFRKRLD